MVPRLTASSRDRSVSTNPVATGKQSGADCSMSGRLNELGPPSSAARRSRLAWLRTDACTCSCDARLLRCGIPSEYAAPPYQQACAAPWLLHPCRLLGAWTVSSCRPGGPEIHKRTICTGLVCLRDGGSLGRKVPRVAPLEAPEPAPNQICTRRTRDWVSQLLPGGCGSLLAHVGPGRSRPTHSESPPDCVGPAGTRQAQCLMIHKDTKCPLPA